MKLLNDTFSVIDFNTTPLWFQTSVFVILIFLLLILTADIGVNKALDCAKKYKSIFRKKPKK